MHWKPGVCILAACVLAGCASPSHRAPVEDRGVPARRAANPGAAARPADPSALPPGAENAGKPGYYTVKPGDTLIRIGLDSGQNWRDIVRWNNLDNPNVIEVGQVLRVVPPAVDPTVASTRPVSPTRVESRPLDSRPAAVPPTTGAAVSGGAMGEGGGSSVPATSSAAASAPATTASGSSAAAVPTAAVRGEEDLVWAWPAHGSVVSSFDEARNKGVGIAGKAGDPVLAAADGRVVYAGSGLRGYGNLVIIKHNNTYLTAYAHNQTLLVKEDQTVRRGQKIAEMGSTDADRVKLHFEIRRQGKPVDPARFLPAR